MSETTMPKTGGPETAPQAAADQSATLSSWSTTRPQMENTSALTQAFTRFNVYLYSKPPSPAIKKINRSFLHLNIFLYRASKGRILGRFGRLDAMLLTTKGAKSGLERVTPVGYIYDRGRYIVCAAPGHFDVPGGPQAKHPAWYHNLRANPGAHAHIGPEQLAVTAEILKGEERDRMWTRFTEVFPFIAEFQKRASHRIPVIALTPDDRDPQEL
ncbi:nitroreductase/quinone reductase family protein [Streptacidiphilus jiangxiensis]|uniref:Deazaflavin-dependent oxidoreductase, nitroreductase family n=1 Tax=Streptacidiphilus jiangxiensis TaxID=235985 RepID=A0A1H7KHG5_STRJI|nr:nitroreductase/quinone reductase family protein [Streptacidiphilus jiangxiensis]SEK86301.1 deazaflavin-dependent oxidoreductase, nitroreductase family [Streptacidiphilus jiangxiensis]